MKTNILKNKTFFLLFFVLSFFSFSSIAKMADTFNYSAFLPQVNSSNYINPASYYDPADFSGQSYPLITEDVPCVDINHKIDFGQRDYVIFGPILKLQMFLYQNQYMKYPPTGLFLYYTYEGVLNFQRDNGLNQTGVIDKYTAAALKQATCPAPVTSNPVPAASNPTPIQVPVSPVVINPTPVVTEPQPTPVNPITYYCSLTNSYYSSYADMANACVINNNQALYTVNFDSNGADSGSVAPPSQSTTQGNAITLPSQGSMVKTGYIFDGWATPNTIQCITTPCPSNSTTYQPGTLYTPTANITLSAVWVQSAAATYTVDYAPNGADSGLPSLNTQSVNVGGSLITASKGSLVKSGYTFVGWSTSPSGPASIPANSSYTPTSDITLYAIWNYNTVSSNNVNLISIADTSEYFYFTAGYPVGSDIIVNYSYDSCNKGYLCTQYVGQAYIYTNSTKSTNIYKNSYTGAVIQNPKILSITPAKDNSYTYLY